MRVAALQPTHPAAGYFWLLHVLARWEKYTAALAARPGDAPAVGELFPFAAFFADAPQPVFKGVDREEVRAGRSLAAPRGRRRSVRLVSFG